MPKRGSLPVPKFVEFNFFLKIGNLNLRLFKERERGREGGREGASEGVRWHGRA